MTTSVQTSLCWNCRQPLTAGSANCLWCGVAQQAADASAQVPAAPGQAGATLPSQTSQRPVVVAPAFGKGLPVGDGFNGTVAGAGARLAAFSIDVVAACAVAAGVAIGTGSAVLTAVSVAEVGVFLWVLEARTGLTIGNAVLRLRTSRADAPYSPGLVRAWVRQAVTGAGFLGLGAGAWLMVGSGAFDSSRRGRSWPDKASSTMSVAVPPRQRKSAAPSQSRGAHASVAQAPTGLVGASAPHQTRPAARLEPQVSGLGSAQVVGGLAKKALAVEDSAAMSKTGASPTALGAVASEHTVPPPIVVSAPPAARTIAPAPGVVEAPTPPPAPQEPPVAQPAQPTAAPLAPAPVPTATQAPNPAPASAQVPAAATPEAPRVDDDGTLLIVFDTGQREHVTLPAAINFGRKPAATEAGDHLIAVTDPEGTVSKTHLRLEHSRGRTWVTDAGSTNGTDLLDEDGTATTIPAGQRTEVPDGVRVRIGNRAFTISVLMGGGSR